MQEWWAHLGLNQGPLACQASALPLSYAPANRFRSRLGEKYNTIKLEFASINRDTT